jgi:uncharacterized membrane protein YkoI
MSDANGRPGRGRKGYDAAMQRRRFLLAVCLALGASRHGSARGLTLQEAIAKVERETQGKVLSAETKRSGNRTVYRIKVLTRDGRVQVIEVPAEAD